MQPWQQWSCPVELLELLAGRSLVALCWDGEQLCYHCVLSTSWVPGSSFAHWSHCISGAGRAQSKAPRNRGRWRTEESGFGGRGRSAAVGSSCCPAGSHCAQPAAPRHPGMPSNSDFHGARICPAPPFHRALMISAWIINRTSGQPDLTLINFAGLTQLVHPVRFQN